MDPMLVGTFSVFIAFPVSVLLHEVGHAVFGRLAGYTVTSLGIGFGRPWLVIPLRGVRVYLTTTGPVQGGLTFAFLPRLLPARLPQMTYIAGGMLVNAALAGLFLAWWKFLNGNAAFCLAFAAVNGGLTLLSLVPLPVYVGSLPIRTDGAHMLEVLTTGTQSYPSPMTIQGLPALRRFLLAVGDTRFLRAYLVSAASDCAALGDAERAWSLLDEEGGMPEPRPPHIPAVASLLRAQIAPMLTPPFDAEPFLEQAATYYRATGQVKGLDYIEFLRADLRISRVEAAGTALDELAGRATFKDHPALGTALLAERLKAACLASDGPAVTRWLRAFESDRRRRPLPTLDLAVYGTVAPFYARQGDLDAADAAYLRLLGAIRELALAWQNPEERARFLQMQATTLDATRDYLESRGRGDEFARFLSSTGENATVVMAEERDRKLRRSARRGMLTNIAVAACLFAPMLVVGVSVPRVLLALGALLAAFTAAGFVYLLIDQTLGRLIPPLKRAGGAVLLILAASPWLIGPAVSATTLFMSWP